MTASNPAWIEACVLARLRAEHSDLATRLSEAEMNLYIDEIMKSSAGARERTLAAAALSVLTPLIEAETAEECAKIAEECGWTIAAWAIRNAFPVPAPTGGE